METRKGRGLLSFTGRIRRLNRKNRLLQSMHRHGRMAMSFSAHSTTPCLRERKIFVEPQESHRKQWAYFKRTEIRARVY